MKPDFADKICPTSCQEVHFAVFPVEGAKPNAYFCQRYKKQLKKRKYKNHYRVYKCTECQYEI